MLKPIVGFAALGLGGLIAFKLFVMILPVVALMFGVMLFGIKLLVIAGMIYLAYRLVQKAMKPKLQVE